MTQTLESRGMAPAFSFSCLSIPLPGQGCFRVARVGLTIDPLGPPMQGDVVGTALDQSTYAPSVPQCRGMCISPVRGSTCCFPRSPNAGGCGIQFPQHWGSRGQNRMPLRKSCRENPQSRHSRENENPHRVLHSQNSSRFRVSPCGSRPEWR